MMYCVHLIVSTYICLMTLCIHFLSNVSLFSDGLKELIQRKPAEERPYVVRNRYNASSLLLHDAVTSTDMLVY
jgi:hypothetical protein